MLRSRNKWVKITSVHNRLLWKLMGRSKSEADVNYNEQRRTGASAWTLVRLFELDPIQLVWMVNEVGKLRETR